MALALLALSGCSSGGDKAAAPGPAPAGPSTTVRPVEPSFTGQNSAPFCALARTYNERFTSVGANPTPAQLRVVAREGQTAIGQAVSAAPAEIKKDVEVIARTFGSLLTELEKVNFEIARLPTSVLATLQATDFQASTARFQAYSQSVCGVAGG